MFEYELIYVRKVPGTLEVLFFFVFSLLVYKSLIVLTILYLGVYI